MQLRAEDKDLIRKTLLFVACAVTALFMTDSSLIAQIAAFGPENPFYSPSTLPFHAPPFDRIKDVDYQPAIEAGMAAQEKEMLAIANNSEAPTFNNTLVAMERT